MSRKKIALVLVFLLAVSGAFSKQNEQSPAKPVHFSLTLGTGWTHYIDNLDYGNKNLNKDFAGLSLRFYWEPEYRLSLGAETGFYTMFKVKSQAGLTGSGDITRKVTPMLLLVRMRIAGNFYLGTGFGLAMVTNSVKGTKEKIVTNTLSLSNYQFSASYIYPIGTRWQLGGEVKVYDFGAYNDWMYSLQALCAYRF